MPNRGLVPIRGHSGVQGGAEVGCVPIVDAATAARWTDVWEFPVAPARGWTAPEMVDHAAAGDVDLFWIVGGNFLETLPDVERSARALRRPRLRIHHDIVLSSSMLVDGDGDVLLLPAATRYESEGGGTETSTERRIIFSPEIPGRRIGSAKPEWWVFGEAMARAFPESRELHPLRQRRGDSRRDRPRGTALSRHRDAGRQGRSGPVGRADAVCGRPVRDARVARRTSRSSGSGRTRRSSTHIRSAATDHLTSPHFLVSTRRGKQFNSMIQRDVDPLTGAGRDAVLVSADDLKRLSLEAGQRVRLTSADGQFRGKTASGPYQTG